MREARTVLIQCGRCGLEAAVTYRGMEIEKIDMRVSELMARCEADEGPRKAECPMLAEAIVHAAVLH